MVQKHNETKQSLETEVKERQVEAGILLSSPTNRPRVVILFPPENSGDGLVPLHRQSEFLGIPTRALKFPTPRARAAATASGPGWVGPRHSGSLQLELPSSAAGWHCHCASGWQCHGRRPLLNCSASVPGLLT
eukprot:2910202-Rhodomonas_salina.2